MDIFWNNPVWSGKHYLPEVVKSGMPFRMTLRTRNASPASNVKLRPGTGQAVSVTRM